MTWAVPTVTEFKTFFARDFNYAPTGSPNDLKFVTDADISRAISDAIINFNSGLFGSDAAVTGVFMYLAAFYLVFNIQNSSQGLQSQSNFPVNSKSVGGVSISFTIPEKLMKDPTFAIYSMNGYGLKYLSLALPFTVGNVGVICGTTTAG